MHYSEEELLKILTTGNYLTEDDITKGREYALTHRDELMSVLATQGYISTDIISQAIAEHLGVAYINLRAHEPDKSLITQIPEEIARKYRIIALEKTETTLSIASDDPTNAGIFQELSVLFPTVKILMHFSGSATIDEMLSLYNKSLQERFDALCAKEEHVAPQLLDAIFSDAVAAYVSDIHFEPYAEKVLIRFRIDGVLRDMAYMGKSYYENVLNRIKIMSNIRLDMHAQTQD